MTWTVSLYRAGALGPSRVTTIVAPSIEAARRVARSFGFDWFRVSPNCPMESDNA